MRKDNLEFFWIIHHFFKNAILLTYGAICAGNLSRPPMASKTLPAG
jgi:hypothetical protein